MQKDLVEKIDTTECDTRHFGKLKEIINAGGSEKLKIVRAFVYGTMIGKGERICDSKTK